MNSRRKVKGLTMSEPILKCHVVECDEAVTHCHWAHDAPYDVQYFCPVHTEELKDPNKTYTVEPWKTELSDENICKLAKGRNAFV